MNAFADSLFSTLLGWVRGLMQSLWSFFSSGGSGGFFAWIGDHYLAVTVILCVIGIAADLLIGFFRETPSPLARELRVLVFRRRDGMGREERKRFDRGYEDGVDMQDLNPDGEGHFPLFESNYAPEDDGLPADGTDSRAWTDELEDAPDPWKRPEAVPTHAADAPGGEERRRRGARHENREKKRLFRRVNSLLPDDGDEGLLDRLPTSVDRKEAFHEPVYPHRRPQ